MRRMELTTTTSAAAEDSSAVVEAEEGEVLERRHSNVQLMNVVVVVAAVAAAVTTSVFVREQKGEACRNGGTRVKDGKQAQSVLKVATRVPISISVSCPSSTLYPSEPHSPVAVVVTPTPEIEIPSRAFVRAAACVPPVFTQAC